MITKMEFIKEVSNSIVDESGRKLYPYRVVQDILECTSDLLAKHVAERETIKALDGLVFEGAVRPPRMYRNPRTGEEIHAPEKTFLKVRAGKKFRE